MLIREFFDWIEVAGVGERAEAAGALAKAFLYADLDPIDAGDAERALTVLLDDPSPVVRRALAEAFATAVDAPLPILLALAYDCAEVATVVLERSLVLADADLLDAVAVGGAAAQAAVARRPTVSAALAGAIADIGDLDAAVILCRNAGATLTDAAARRLLERFRHEARLHEALLGRPDLAPERRHALCIATAERLSAFVRMRGWATPERIRRVLDEACDKAATTIAATDDLEGHAFAAYLQAAGQLTPALLTRALLCGNLALFEAALTELSGRRPDRVAGFVRNPGGLGFAALCREAGLLPSLVPALRAALQSLDDEAPRHGFGCLDRGAVVQVLARCGPDLAGDTRLAGLLRRFEAEAAREQARTARTEGRGDLPPRQLAPPPRQIALPLPVAA